VQSGTSARPGTWTGWRRSGGTHAANAEDLVAALVSAVCTAASTSARRSRVVFDGFSGWLSATSSLHCRSSSSLPCVTSTASTLSLSVPKIATGSLTDLRVDLIKCVSNVCPRGMSAVRPSPKKFLRFQWNLVCRYRSMTDAWWYAVWPDTRSRSRSQAFESRKYSHFRRLSPPTFIMGAGKWPRIYKLGHNTCSLSGQDLLFLS